MSPICNPVELQSNTQIYAWKLCDWDALHFRKKAHADAGRYEAPYIQAMRAIVQSRGDIEIQPPIQAVGWMPPRPLEGP